jgi:asparagine synthase (glutamine-hydrolysing)
MCGIVGFNWHDAELLKRMTEKIVHRGPDEVSLFTTTKISIGMTRLSIIDLRSNLYPIKNEDGSIWLMFNGEIYNFEEIKEELIKLGHSFKTHTDGEVIVHSYEEWGEFCVNKFNGMFAFCIYDGNKNQFFLARDRMGIKPLYYYFKGGKFIFASEIKSILEYGMPRKINKEALNHYISLRYNPLEETMFKGIWRLKPGHTITVYLGRNKLSISKYWDINTSRNEEPDEKVLYDLMKDSVEKELISDVPLGVYLSGGLDSSAIVNFMSELRAGGANRIKTYTVGFSECPMVNETSYAKQVSDHFFTEHKEFEVTADVTKLLPEIVWFTDEPVGDPALIPVYLLSKEAKKTATVILTGDGGDEIFAGYDQYRFMTILNRISKIPLAYPLAKLATKIIPLKFFNKFYKHSSNMGGAAYKRGLLVLKNIRKNPARAYYELIGIFDDDERKEVLKGSFYQDIDYKDINRSGDFLKRLQYFDAKVLLPESYLMKSDRMTMAWGVESRVPLLDHRLVEMAFSIKSKYKMRGLYSTKYIFRKILKDKLPGNIADRKKQSFHVPIENWIDKKPELLKIIQESKIINSAYVRRIIRNYKSGKLFYARQLWSLITLELWYRIYILQQKVEL